MPILPAFFLMAHAAQTQRTEFVLHHRRPSAVLAGIKGVDATLVAYDDRGTVGIDGSPAAIETARNLLKLLDSPRKNLLIRVTVVSPVDHLIWEVDARLVNGQKWRTSDDETNLELALEPRVADDGTLDIKVFARCRGIELTSAMRLPKGQSRKLALGRKIVQDIEVGSDSVGKMVEGGISLPTITVRYISGS